MSFPSPPSQPPSKKRKGQPRNPCECRLCLKGFDRLEQLRTHLQRCHGLRPKPFIHIHWDQSQLRYVQDGEAIPFAAPAREASSQPTPYQQLQLSPEPVDHQQTPPLTDAQELLPSLSQVSHGLPNNRLEPTAGSSLDSPFLSLGNSDNASPPSWRSAVVHRSLSSPAPSLPCRQGILQDEVEDVPARADADDQFAAALSQAETSPEGVIGQAAGAPQGLIGQAAGDSTLPFPSDSTDVVAVSALPSAFGALCGRDACPHRHALQQWILHCVVCASSRASMNFHLCERCFLDMRGGRFTVNSMSPLDSHGSDGSEAAVADHVAKHKFTRVYNRYRTKRDDWQPEHLPPSSAQLSVPAFSTADACAPVVTKLFKVGCVINDLSGCLDLERWKVLQNQLEPNYFDMSVFYHQAAEHEFLALLFWLRSNILDGGVSCIGLNFLDASGLPYLQHMRTFTDMARLLFRKWEASIRAREPDSQVDLSTFNFEYIRDLVLALQNSALLAYFADESFRNVFHGFTCGPRPTRYFRELNDRLKQIIDQQSPWLHQLLLTALAPVSELIKPGSSQSVEGISHTIGSYLDVVFWVGRELQQFWFWRTCRHTMSALSYDVLRAYNAVDGQQPPRGDEVTNAERDVVNLMWRANYQLQPREAISSEDRDVIEDTIKSVTGGNLRHFVRALVTVEVSTPVNKLARSRLRQLVNLLVFTWRGIDSSGLARALGSLDDPRCLALSRVLAPYVDWSPVEPHMMEITCMMRGTEMQRSITQSLMTGLRGRSIESLRAVIQPSVPRLIAVGTAEEEKYNEMLGPADAEQFALQEGAGSGTQL